MGPPKLPRSHRCPVRARLPQLPCALPPPARAHRRRSARLAGRAAADVVFTVEPALRFIICGS
uniref:Uncharacterized protein n=1 Tax=Arundo donax TaxID=35708 RepID=A0A0A9F444_ARUDO